MPNLQKTMSEMMGRKLTVTEARKLADEQFGRLATYWREQEQKSDREHREDYSKLLARKNEFFIKEHSKRGHNATVANALRLQKSILHNALGRDKFDTGVFMLEIDKILIENEIVGYWFWGQD